MATPLEREPRGRQPAAAASGTSGTPGTSSGASGASGAGAGAGLQDAEPRARDGDKATAANAPLPPSPLTALHVAAVAATAAAFFAFSSPAVTYFDPETLRPTPDFPAWVRAAAHATNVPIKLGVLHVALYATEFWYDRGLFRRHVGQRFTTLWYQLPQPPRYGQHLQMQLETLMQLCDALARREAAAYPLGAVVAIGGAGTVVMAQSALTSIGWHSMQEQSAGFALALLKLALDYSPYGVRVNERVGGSLSDAAQWAGGALMLGTGYVVNGFEALHPTAVATLIFAGGALVALVAVALRVRGSSGAVAVRRAASA